MSIYLKALWFRTGVAIVFSALDTSATERLTMPNRLVIRKKISGREHSEIIFVDKTSAKVPSHLCAKLKRFNITSLTCLGSIALPQFAVGAQAPALRDTCSERRKNHQAAVTPSTVKSVRGTKTGE